MRWTLLAFELVAGLLIFGCTNENGDHAVAVSAVPTAMPEPTTDTTMATPWTVENPPESPTPRTAESVRVLASQGNVEAVDWLAKRIEWENAAAFISAPIEWPDPPPEAISREKALDLANKALDGRVLNERRPPDGRYLTIDCLRFWEGRWYAIYVQGHPALAGRFYCVILDAVSGNVLRSEGRAVLR